MVDWHYVLAHGMWILGLAVSLAAFANQDWSSRRSFLTGHHVGLVLVAAGLALRPSAPVWAQAVCLTLAFASAGALFVTRRSALR